MKPLVFQNPKVKQLPSATVLDLQAATTANASLNIPHGTAPTSPTNGDVWTTTAGIYVRVNGVTVGPLAAAGGGGGSVAWTLAGSWTHSVNVANVDVTGLGSYNELLIIARSVTASASGVRSIQVSVDNGSTYFTTSGDYSTVASDGTVTLAAALSHSTATTAARTLFAHILNTKGVVKAVDMHNSSGVRSLFLASASDINAIRLANSAGGNLTGGVMEVYGR